MNTINKKISNLKHLEYLNNFEILGKNLLELNKKNPTSQINDMMEALNGIGIYVSLLIFYTFETLFFTGIIYFLLIPVSFLHYRKQSKKLFISSNEDDDEDVL